MTRKTRGNTNLPKYVYARGNRLWISLKDETGKWVYRKTPFDLTQVEQARQLVEASTKRVAAQVSAKDPNKMTVRKYISRWAKEREERGVRSAKRDSKKLEKYVGEILDMSIEEVRPVHVRDMVRELRKLVNVGTIAPRTALHVYSALHNVFENAVVDELIIHNPVKVKNGELPNKIDKDPEWRSQAVYMTSEVRQLISDPRIPAERRVQYALKSIAGMRHGESAAICWRHLDVVSEPLGRLNIVQSWDSLKSEIKSTKTEHTRQAVIHPTLASILEVWRSTHWERIYGRRPTPDDFVVPTRNFTCVSAGDAGKAMCADFDLLGLRKLAGKKRHRGGHDLRSWYKTQTVEDGADSLLIRRTTHAPPRDVDGGYNRFSWSAICREVAKLKIDVVGVPLTLTPGSLQAERKASGRWKQQILVTPKGIERVFEHVFQGESHDSSSEEYFEGVSTSNYGGVKSLHAVEKALLAGDNALALAAVKRMLARSAPPCGRAHHHAPRDIVQPTKSAPRARR